MYFAWCTIGLCPENVSLSAGAEYTTRLPGYANYKTVPPGKYTGIKWSGNNRVDSKVIKPPPKVATPEVTPDVSAPVHDLAPPPNPTVKVQVEGVVGPVNTSFVASQPAATTISPPTQSLPVANTSVSAAPVIQV